MHAIGECLNSYNNQTFQAWVVLAASKRFPRPRCHPLNEAKISTRLGESLYHDSALETLGVVASMVAPCAPQPDATEPSWRRGGGGQIFTTNGIVARR